VKGTGGERSRKERVLLASVASIKALKETNTGDRRGSIAQDGKKKKIKGHRLLHAYTK